MEMDNSGKASASIDEEVCRIRCGGGDGQVVLDTATTVQAAMADQ